MDNNVVYFLPMPNEDAQTSNSRHLAMRNQIIKQQLKIEQQSKIQKKHKQSILEKKLQMECHTHNVLYVPQIEGESKAQSSARRAKMRGQLRSLVKSINNAEEQIMSETKLHNMEVGETRSISEKKLQMECHTHNVTYVPQIEGESKAQTYCRHHKMRLQFPSLCKSMNNAEKQIMYETKLHNIEYLPVVLGETRSDAYLRHSKMRQLFPVQLNKKNVDIEKELNQDCELYGVKYFPPVTGEKKSQLLQRHNKIRKAFLLDVIENEFKQKVSQELSKNPNVTKKIQNFQIGKKTCNRILY